MIFFPPLQQLDTGVNSWTWVVPVWFPHVHRVCPPFPLDGLHGSCCWPGHQAWRRVALRASCHCWIRCSRFAGVWGLVHVRTSVWALVWPSLVHPVLFRSCLSEMVLQSQLCHSLRWQAPWGSPAVPGSRSGGEFSPGLWPARSGWHAGIACPGDQSGIHTCHLPIQGSLSPPAGPVSGACGRSPGSAPPGNEPVRHSGHGSG